MPPETLTPASVHWGHMRAQDRKTQLCSKPGRSPSHQLPSQGLPETHIERKAILPLPGLFFCSSATSRAPLVPLKAGGPEQEGPSSGRTPGPALAHKQMGRARVALVGRGLGESVASGAQGCLFVETPDMEPFTVIFLVGVRTPRAQGLWPSWSQDDYRRLPQGQS